MKKFASSLLAVSVLFISSAKAERNPDINTEVLAKTITNISVASERVLNMINWKVGDNHKLKVKFLFGGGSSVKSVPSEDKAQNAVWMKQEMDLMGQKQVTETLLSRADGKVLKQIVNGEEQDPNAGGGEVEIIEQYEDQVTTPAGTFDCFYIKARITAEGQQPTEVELWINPIEVGLDGQIKLVAQTQFGPLTMELTEYNIQ